MDLAKLKATRRAFRSSLYEDDRVEYADIFIGGFDRCKNVWINGFDCESILTAGGIVMTVDTPDGEDIAIAVTIDPLTTDLVLQKSINTIDRDNDFRDLEAFCEKALRHWIQDSSSIVVVEKS